MQKNDRRLKLSLSLHRNFVKVLLITAAFKAGERRWDAGSHIILFLHRQLGRTPWIRRSEKQGWKWPPPTLRERVATPPWGTSWHKETPSAAIDVHFPSRGTFNTMLTKSNEVRPEAAWFAMGRKAPLSLGSALYCLFLTWFVNETLSTNASRGDNLIKLAFPLTQNLAWNAQRLLRFLKVPL